MRGSTQGVPLSMGVQVLSEYKKVALTEVAAMQVTPPPINLCCTSPDAVCELFFLANSFSWPASSSYHMGTSTKLWL